MISLIKRKFKSMWKPFNILSTIEAQSTHLAAKKMKLAKTNPDAVKNKNQNLAPSTSTPISRIFMMLTSCKRSRSQKSERKASQKEDKTLLKSQVDLMSQEVLNSKIRILDLIWFFTLCSNLEAIFITFSGRSLFHLDLLTLFFWRSLFVWIGNIYFSKVWTENLKREGYSYFLTISKLSMSYPNKKLFLKKNPIQSFEEPKSSSF